jgi:hypothetical protein
VTKKVESTPLAIAKTAGPRAVADVLALPTKMAAAGPERVNVVLARELRGVLTGDPAALVESCGARARREL